MTGLGQYARDLENLNHLQTPNMFALWSVGENLSHSSSDSKRGQQAWTRSGLRGSENPEHQLCHGAIQPITELKPAWNISEGLIVWVIKGKSQIHSVWCALNLRPQDTCERNKVLVSPSNCMRWQDQCCLLTGFDHHPVQNWAKPHCNWYAESFQWGQL